MGSRTTITIARQMGCGGAYMGQIIAQKLGLRYVDREVLHLAAQSLGCSEEAVTASRERLTSFWSRFFSGLTVLPPESPYTPPPLRSFTDEELFRTQVKVLKLIAAREDCVIVGYGAAFVLPCHNRMVNLYFHAPRSYRLKRVAQLYSLQSTEEAERMIEQSDEMRRTYFAEMTDRDWSCADNYHLCIDTSIYPHEELAERLVKFIERKLALDRASK